MFAAFSPANRGIITAAAAAAAAVAGTASGTYYFDKNKLKTGPNTMTPAQFRGIIDAMKTKNDSYCMWMLNPSTVAKRVHPIHSGNIDGCTQARILGPRDEATGCQVGQTLTFGFTEPRVFYDTTTGEPKSVQSVPVRCNGIVLMKPGYTKIDFEITDPDLAMPEDMVNVSVTDMLDLCGRGDVQIYNRVGGVSTNYYLSIEAGKRPPSTMKNTKFFTVKLNVKDGQKNICSCFATTQGKVSGWFMANVGLLSPGATDWGNALQYRKLASLFGLVCFKPKDRAVLPPKGDDDLLVAIHVHTK